MKYLVQCSPSVPTVWLPCGYFTNQGVPHWLLEKLFEDVAKWSSTWAVSRSSVSLSIYRSMLHGPFTATFHAAGTVQSGLASSAGPIS